MIKIRISSLNKSVKTRVKVPVRRKTGTFLEYRLKGRDSPTTYDSMPNHVEINPEALETMNKRAAQSLSMGRELSSSLDSEKGKMSLGKSNVGDECSCSIRPGVLGVWHSHPGTEEQNTDTFSLLDVINTVRFKIPIMMAQTCYNDRVWAAIPSDETATIKDKRQKLNKWELLGEQEDQGTAEGRSSAQDYRNHVKKLCDEFKIKLYQGKNGILKEYQGDW